MAVISEYTPMTPTAKGLHLQAKVLAGTASLNLKRAVIGEGYLEEGQSPMNLTALIAEVPSHQYTVEDDTALVDFTRHYVVSDGITNITIRVTNGNMQFYLREIGIIADDPDEGEILYAYANFGDYANNIMAFNGVAHIARHFNFPIIIRNTADFDVNITYPAEVSWEEFIGHVKATGNVHNMTPADLFPANSDVLLKISAEDISKWNNMISMLMKGAANGVAELDANGMVPASQLPSYVDDVLNGTAQGVTETGAGTYSATGFILNGQTDLCTPEDEKTYIDTATNIQYRWTGTVFVSMGSNLALGQTNRTAGRGDWTKTAYDHSQSTHAPTTAATQSAMGLMSAADKKKLDGIETGAQTHRAPTSTEIRSALGYTPTSSETTAGLSSRISIIEEALAETVPDIAKDKFPHIVIRRYDAENEILYFSGFPDYTGGIGQNYWSGTYYLEPYESGYGATKISLDISDPLPWTLSGGVYKGGGAVLKFYYSLGSHGTQTRGCTILSQT